MFLEEDLCNEEEGEDKYAIYTKLSATLVIKKDI